MPTYAVEREGRDKPRVVEAANPAAARQYVAKDELKVRKIETREAFALANDGVELEVAGEEPPVGHMGDGD
jgi:hypothetical protein